VEIVQEGWGVKGKEEPSARAGRHKGLSFCPCVGVEVVVLDSGSLLVDIADTDRFREAEVGFWKDWKDLRSEIDGTRLLDESKELS
jgi:hypothetical protein